MVIGRQLGPYRIVSLLGIGGMGEVYRAHDTKLGRDVAIRLLSGVFAADSDRLSRFRREARLLATLNHPHIGAIYGSEEADGIYALVMELLEGDTLDTRIAKGPLPLEDALRIARDVADALEAAHTRGIVHGDLKPSNIKLTPDGHATVVGFGLVKAGEAGVIIGAAAYMSPEQARGKAVDKTADNWAFGCVLFEMLSGFVPFDGETVTDILAAVVQRDPNWVLLPGTIPLKVRRVIERCLRKEPSKRLRDIGDAKIDIEDVVSGQRRRRRGAIYRRLLRY